MSWPGPRKEAIKPAVGPGQITCLRLTGLTVSCCCDRAPRSGPSDLVSTEQIGVRSDSEQP
jgi:hypothetical protein